MNVVDEKGLRNADMKKRNKKKRFELRYEMENFYRVNFNFIERIEILCETIQNAKTLRINPPTIVTKKSIKEVQKF